MSLFTDGFNRADSATTLGSPWSALSGTWGITSNKAYKVANGNTHEDVVVDVGQADMDITVVAGTLVTYQGLTFRAVDASHLWFLQWGGDFGIHIVNGGGDVIVQNFGTSTIVAGDTVRVLCVGNTIKVYRNGVQVGTTLTDSRFNSATKCGLHAYTAGATWDNFNVDAPVTVGNLVTQVGMEVLATPPSLTHNMRVTQIGMEVLLLGSAPVTNTGNFFMLFP